MVLYACVLTTNNLCVAAMHAPEEISDSIMFKYVPVSIDPSIYLNKYFYNDTWYSRTWNEYDDNGIPVESAGYVDTEWTPN